MAAADGAATLLAPPAERPAHEPALRMSTARGGVVALLAVSGASAFALRAGTGSSARPIAQRGPSMSTARMYAACLRRCLPRPLRSARLPAPSLARYPCVTPASLRTKQCPRSWRLTWMRRSGTRRCIRRDACAQPLRRPGCLSPSRSLSCACSLPRSRSLADLCPSPDTHSCGVEVRRLRRTQTGRSQTEVGPSKPHTDASKECGQGKKLQSQT